MTFRKRIISAFRKATAVYDNNAEFQRAINDELLGRLKTATGNERDVEKILDIGCGTGFLTLGIKTIFPDARVVGCDITHSMLKVVRDKAKENTIKLVAADGESLPFTGRSFDLITSNLAYQWMPHLDRAFKEAFRILKEGGSFIFSTLGEETFSELKASYALASKRTDRDGLPPFMDLPARSEIVSLMEKTGFFPCSIEGIVKRRCYINFWNLLKTVKNIGAGNPYTEGDKSLARGSILKEMARIYTEKFSLERSRLEEMESWRVLQDGEAPSCAPVYATYDVILAVSKKP